MLLQERSNDPEQILTNLGFGDANEDNPTERIPDRFKDISCSETAPNIFSDNPELTQLLHAFTSQQEAAGTSDLQQGTNMEAIMTGHGELSPIYYLSFQAFYLFLKAVPLHYIEFKRLAELLNFAEENLELPRKFFEYLLLKLHQCLSKKRVDVHLNVATINEEKQEMKEGQEETTEDIPGDMALFRNMSDSEIYKHLNRDLSDGLDVAHNPKIVSLLSLRPGSLNIGKDMQTLQLASFRSVSSEDSPNPKSVGKKVSHQESKT